MASYKDRYLFRNEVTEPRTMMTLQELIDHCRMNGIPRDAVLIFRGDRQDPKTDRNVVSVVRAEKHSDLTYLTLGGHL